MDDQPDGNCIELLRKGIDEYVPETAGIAPAHRIRDLEFEHLVLLHGGWNCARRAVDAGAPRRLYYVAMTRARQTLALPCLLGANPFPPCCSPTRRWIFRPRRLKYSGGTGGSATLHIRCIRP